MMLSTVKENVKSYTKHEVKRGYEARRLMAILGRPSERQLKQILDNVQLRGCEMTSQDITNARNILGPDVGSLKGKMTRRKESHIHVTVRPIPTDIF